MPQQFPRKWCLKKKKLPDHAEKLRRQDIMMKDTATVLPRHDPTKE
jgi:hypothetical protein